MSPGRPALDGSQGPVVLVAEDEGAVRRLIRRILVADGCEVLEALDGQDALTIARSSRRTIDVLVTDVLMPGLDGISLAEQLVSEGIVSRVVVCSGYSGGRTCVRLEGVARWTVLAKPFRPPDLSAALREVLAPEPSPGPEGASA